MVEMDNTRGIATGGLTTGIIGTALGAMNSGILPGLFGGNNNCGALFTWERELSHKDSEIAMLRADRDTDKKVLELYQYVDGRMRNIEGQLAQQAVVNAQIGAIISCMQKSIDVLSGLTRTIIPIDNICPPAMLRYNSWVAPTTEATTAPTT